MSDTGNIRDSLGFFGGFLGNSIGYGSNDRFSNGNVWHEYLSADMGLNSSNNSLNGGNNYAYGGALAAGGDGITGAIAKGMDEQIDDYIDDSTTDTDALYIAWVGGNDVRGYVGQTDPIADLEQTLDNMAASLAQLIDSGVSTLLVPNLPDLGSIPEFANSSNSLQAHDLTVAWNEGLESRLISLGLSTNADIFYFDVYSTFNELLANPGDFGFSNTTDECRSLSFFGSERQCSNSSEYVFWDYIHPTTASHELLADYAFDLLQSNNVVPTPNALVLIISGLLMVGVQRRKFRKS